MSKKIELAVLELDGKMLITTPENIRIVLKDLTQPGMIFEDPDSDPHSQEEWVDSLLEEATVLHIKPLSKKKGVTYGNYLIVESRNSLSIG